MTFIPHQLRDTPLSERHRILTDHIRQWLCDFLELDSMDEVAPEQNFAELGTSSTEAVSFKLLLDDKLSCSLRTTLLFDYPRLDLLVSYLLEEVLQLSGKPAEPIRRSLETSGPIAVIAMEGVFPEAGNATRFWERIDQSLTLDLLQTDRMYYGKIEDPECSPENPLKLSPADLNALDRPALILLALLEQSMERYNLSGKDLINTETGVFVAADRKGASSDKAWQLPLANVFSYYLNMRGPSETINTFCTSVYSALHRAVQSLQMGECTQAVVAGINLIDEDEFRYAENKGLYQDLLSRDNRTRSFCEGANGFVRSEGAGILLLKPLAKAEQDRNTILAVIKGSAVHHGGRGYSPEAPNIYGIRETIQKCLQQAAISPDTIDYIEAHGIGNSMADVMELSALSSAYCSLSQSADKTWPVGSVKSVAGHPEIASGMASLIKVLQAMQYGRLPGIAGFGQINKELAPNNRLVLRNSSVQWPRTTTPGRVALNSYAIGGLSAHIILEQYQAGSNSGNIPAYAPATGTLSKATQDLLTDRISSSTYQILDELTREIFALPLCAIDPERSPVQYGFDSIRIIQLLRRVNERLGIQLRLGQIMALENFRAFFELTDRVSQQKRQATSSLSEQNTILKKRQPLSEVQKGLWFIQESRPESTGFNVPLLFSMPESLQIHALQHALLDLLREFPILRINIVRSEEGIPQQVISDMPDSITIQEHHLTGYDQAPGVLAFSLLRQPFCLAADRLLRAHVLRTPDREYVLLVIHHIVIDGFAGVHFTNRLWEKYTSYCQGNHPEIKAPDLSFFNFVQWEQNYLNSIQATEDLAWWKEELQQLSPTIPLPYDRHPSAGQTINSTTGNEKRIIDKAVLQRLQTISEEHNTSLSVLLLSVFNLFLYKITGEENIALSTPVAGRPLRLHENSVGCYINLIITRTFIDGNQTLSELIQQVKRRFVDALDHSWFPFPLIVSELGLSTNPESLPLPVSYTYQNIFDDLSTDDSNLPQLLYEVYQETDDYYTLEVYDRREQVELNLKYKTTLFDQNTIQRHLRWFSHLLESVTAASDQLLRSYQLTNDKADILQLAQGPEIQLPDTNIVELIQRQSQLSPENTALICGTKHISYRQLYTESGKIAAHLQNKGIQTGSLVALYMPRSAEAVITLIGILRSGAAYMPVDHSTGTERLALLLKDSGATCLIVAAFCDNLKNVNAEVLLYEQLVCSEAVPENIQQTICADQLAYVLYTSGSTGAPKGVMIEHRSLLNLSLAMCQYYAIRPEDRILQFASLSFDMSVEELFPCLISGATVVLREEEDTELSRFSALVQRHRITMLNLPPNYFTLLTTLPAEDQQKLFATVRLIAFGGEQLNEAVWQAARTLGVPQLFNAYGPTECTVNASIAELSHSEQVHIGRPLANTQLYVLGRDMELLPPGIEGELYVAGTGIARGYLNQPELTEDKFIPNPFGKGKLYKTGDRAKWNKEGNLEYLGRTDEQVKIRGFRVEPEEIEGYILRIPAIRHAAVVAVDTGRGHTLVAYYTSEETIQPETIKTFLTGKLPGYMIPEICIMLHEFPLTANGKTDRKTLRQRNDFRSLPLRYTPPASPMEEQILAIWKDVLNIKRIGVSDHFYDLGGHSLLALQIQSRIQKHTGLRLTLKEFFGAGTVRGLASLLENRKDKTQEADLEHYEEGRDELLF